jgi:hypothetical protein
MATWNLALGFISKGQSGYADEVIEYWSDNRPRLL